VINFLSILRLKEIVGKTGFFIVGMLFATPAITENNILVAVEFLGLCVLNGMAIYLINAGFGYEQDVVNHRLHYLQKYKRSSILVAGFLLLIIALILLYLFKHELLLPALSVYFIWIFYSLPNGLKGIPIMGIVCAFIAQILHFHIGYLVFSGWNSESIFLSIYFALLFCGGHALHEVIDFEADKNAGVKTSAVFFGRRHLFYVSNLIFGVSILYIITFMVMNVLPFHWVMPYYFAFAFQLWFFLGIPKEWDKNDLFNYRRKYMTAYGIATVAVMLMMYL
jgi:4-hydroxybenzoate polyprenyltransferase